MLDKLQEVPSFPRLYCSRHETHLAEFVRQGTSRMTNEEFEKLKAFIIEKQAKFSADMDRLSESQARYDRVDTERERQIAQIFRGLAQTERGLAQTERRTEEFNRRQDQAERGFERIRELQALTEIALAKLSVTVEELGIFVREGFKETDAKLSALIDSQMRLDEQQRRTANETRTLSSDLERHKKEGHPET